jgi:REP element-mobilizing transposase RayT
MPDHLHGIVTTRTSDDRPLPTIGEIVRWFKAATHASWRAGIHKRGWPPYEGRLWQPDYHDHVVRDAEELARIRQYIATNPSQWLLETDETLDQFRPSQD